MDDKDKTNKPRRPGEHLNRGEVKTIIIEYILNRNDAVPGPDIRNHLREKHRVTDRKNIEDHLRNLKKAGCIEKFDKDGFENKWDITKIEHLKNIQIKFEDIELNQYEKSLIVILRESRLDMQDLDSLECFFELLLSISFFNECMDIGLEKLQDRAWEIYLYDKGFERNQKIKGLMKNYYEAYIKNNPNFKMSEETFQKIMEEIAKNKKSFGGGNPVSETLEEKFPYVAKEIYEKTKEIWILMSQQKLIFLVTRYRLLFEHYFYQDVLNDIITPGELDFAMKTKENRKEYSIFNFYFEKLKLISELVFEHKKPSFFNTNGTRGNVLKEIIDFYRLDYSSIPDEIKELIKLS